nr:hypothetical protein GCM10020092_022860 [Actinoplanes digitatis]
MPEAVVDLLEAVQVEEEHRHIVVRAAVFQGRGDPLAEQGAVGELGERVVVRLVHELLLQLLALADVAGVQDQAADVRVVEQVGDGDLGLPHPAVVVRQGHLDHRCRVRLIADRAQGLGEPAGRCGVEQADEPAAGEHVRRVAEDPLHGLALVEHLGVGADHGHHVRAVLHQRVEALLAGGQLGGAVGDPGLEVAGEVAVLQQGEHLAAHDQQDQGRPGVRGERRGLPGAQEPDDAGQQRGEHGDVRQQHAERLGALVAGGLDDRASADRPGGGEQDQHEAERTSRRR